MSLENEKQLKYFELVPLKQKDGFNGGVIRKSRILVGRAQNCDIVINKNSISSVHAIIEIVGDKAKVYDMNSTNGTFVNGSKKIVADIKIGDNLKFADVETIFKEYTTEDLPPVLELLKPEKPPVLPLKNVAPEVKNRIMKSSPEDYLPNVPKVSEDKMPYLIYPLAADPKAEYSEYIFEDVEALYPIFKYELGRDAVEVMILHKGLIYSVDYLPERNQTIYLSGAYNKNDEVEFPFLAKNERQPLLEMKGSAVSVYNLFGYEVLHLTNQQLKSIPNKNELLVLKDNDIVKFSKGDLEIYIRKTESPPRIATAPIFRRDKDVRKYFLLLLFFVMLPMSFLQMFEVDKELEKDKVPERIATILYKEKLIVNKNDAIKKTEDKKQEAQKSPLKVEPKEKTEVAQKPAEKPVEKPVVKPEPDGVKTAKKVEQVKKAQAAKATEKVTSKNPAPPKPSPVKNVSVTVTPAVKPTPAQTVKKPTPFKGTVDVFKATSFTSSLNSLLAKGGQVSTASAVSATSIDDTKSAVVGGGSVTGAVKTANVATDTGSLTGATVGKIADSKGAEGLSDKKTIFTAGIPAETVVLGSMDPDIIRRILREHIPQFRFCYQKELDAKGGSVSGIVPLSFVIGASGHVTQAGVKSGSGLPAPVQKCVTNVLYGIKFPSPLGGGTVEVDQPINFYPQKL